MHRNLRSRLTHSAAGLALVAGVAVVLAGSASADAAADPPASPDLPSAPEGAAEALAPLAPFVGKTWRGEFAPSGSRAADGPTVDVARWEWALNGQAIRILHSIDDGVYGGESLIFKDPEEEGLVFFYFTTGGFYTRGTIEVPGPGRYVSHEEVTGSEEGITRVRSTSEVLPDGRLHVETEYFRDGEWGPGNERTYVEAPDAEVVFRNPE